MAIKQTKTKMSLKLRHPSGPVSLAGDVSEEIGFALYMLALGPTPGSDNPLQASMRAYVAACKERMAETEAATEIIDKHNAGAGT
jgi:ethanolamine ammonia-lyase small subunit